MREKLNRTRDSRDDNIIPDVVGTQVPVGFIASPVTNNGNNNNANGASSGANANPSQASHATSDDDTPSSATATRAHSVNPGGGSSGGSSQATAYITQEASKKSVFGTDYQRNPMIFFSLGIYAVTIALACLGVIVISIVVYSRLHETENYGKESMSSKSKEEQIVLTKILMLISYIPIILVTILAANYVVCVVRQKSM